MLQQLQDQADNLQHHLKKGDYSFIGPQDQRLFETFMRRANDIAPSNPFDHSIHDVLSNKQATLAALKALPAGTPLRIYVVTPTHDDSVLPFSTIEDYCSNHNIVL
ncbi:hypothetical protein [Chitinophaga caseinilytica]|uniref:Uncharacterized protein n=1 Tax=Chitinophaga caseinilytica TaxID=2267521 RepID=A0ABZ2YXC0_9BACT